MTRLEFIKFDRLRIIAVVLLTIPMFVNMVTIDNIWWRMLLDGSIGSLHMGDNLYTCFVTLLWMCFFMFMVMGDKNRQDFADLL